MDGNTFLVVIVLLFVLRQGLACSPGWPATHYYNYVDQAGHELTEIHLPFPPRVLGLKEYTTTPISCLFFEAGSRYVVLTGLKFCVDQADPETQRYASSIS